MTIMIIVTKCQMKVDFIPFIKISGIDWDDDSIVQASTYGLDLLYLNKK